MTIHDEIKICLQNALTLDELYVHSNDGSHFQIIAVGSCFFAVSRVKKEQMISSLLAEWIANNRIHALSIKTFTPDEWKHKRIFLNL